MSYIDYIEIENFKGFGAKVRVPLDRRQKTEDRRSGCMSLRMLQPSSFVFCPLSFVLQ